jgi:hypothetical protein
MSIGFEPPLLGCFDRRDRTLGEGMIVLLSSLLFTTCRHVTDFGRFGGVVGLG